LVCWKVGWVGVLAHYPVLASVRRQQWVVSSEAVELSDRKPRATRSHNDALHSRESPYYPSRPGYWREAADAAFRRQRESPSAARCPTPWLSHRR
jgi:hypothetical protein